MLTRPDPTRQNPGKSWPDLTRPRGSIRPVDNSGTDTSMGDDITTLLMTTTTNNNTDQLLHTTSSYYDYIREKSIVQVRAVVMLYDDARKDWIQSGSNTGLSKVQIYQHSINNTFRIVGRNTTTAEREVGCQCCRPTYSFRWDKWTW